MRIESHSSFSVGRLSIRTMSRVISNAITVFVVIGITCDGIRRRQTSRKLVISDASRVTSSRVAGCQHQQRRTSPKRRRCGELVESFWCARVDMREMQTGGSILSTVGPPIGRSDARDDARAAVRYRSSSIRALALRCRQPAPASAMNRAGSRSKNEARLLEVLLMLQLECRRCGGKAWLSRRQLTERVLYRGAADTLALVAQLVRMGKIFRISARGRGRGRGRTLYWLPGARKTHILRALRQEGMPADVIAQALRFFSPPENGSREDREQSFRVTPSRIEEKKDARPRAPTIFSAPSVPPRPVPSPYQARSAPPSLGRLAKHGFRPLSPVAALLSVITDNPDTHPADCQCGFHGNASDKSRQLKPPHIEAPG